jgi:hypothetical protein
MPTRAIIIEGPDGAGKSTLLYQLAKDLDRKIQHGGGPPRDQMEWRDRVKRMRDFASEPVILDRIPFISEQVYGPLYGRKPDRSLTTELIALNPVVVFCCLPSETQMRSFIDFTPKAHKPDTHMQLVLENYSTIVHDYRVLMIDLACQGVQVLPYSWVTDDYDHFLQELKKCAD